MAPSSKPSDSIVAFQAALDGNLRLLKKMASKVNLQELKDVNGRNVLYYAAARGHLEVCRFLVEELGLDVNSTADEGGTPAHYAAARENERVLGYLLDRGGNPRVRNSKGSTPLHDAAEQGHCEAVRLLLSKGVDVDPVNYHGTPLHLAAAKDKDQVVKILLEHGADPNKVVNHVFLPLMMACCGHSLKSMKLLVTPLMMACCGHSLKSMKLLVQAGADVNFIRHPGSSILMKAVGDNLTDIVKFLLEAGADPNIGDEDGDIPIMCAAVHGHRDLVEILFPKTRPIPSVPDWSVDGIIRSMKYLRFKAQDLRPFSTSEPSRRTTSESRASSAFPARLMEPSTFDDSMDYKILTCLVTNKTLAKDRCSWDPTDDEVQRAVLPLLQGFMDIDASNLKQRIDEFQMIVKNHWERNEQIVANKELLLDVFDYVTPDFVPNTCNGKKRTSICWDEKDDRATQHRSKRSSCSESVDNHLAGLLDQRAAVQGLLEKRAVVQEVLTGPLNMEQCIDKLTRCGFSDQLLWHAIDILKVDLELRQVFLSLGDPDAKGYILHALRSSHV